MQNIDVEAQRAMGLLKYDVDRKGIANAEREVLSSANEILGFS